MTKRGRPRKERHAALAGSFHKNPKIRRISNEAAGVYAKALSYCAHDMTDGLVPLEMMEMWARPKRWPAVRKELLAGSEAPGDRPLISVEGNDVRIHDFLDWNISRAEWDAKLQADADRKSTPKRHRKSADFPIGNPSEIGPESPPDSGGVSSRARACEDEDEDEDPSLARGDARAPEPRRPLGATPAGIAQGAWFRVLGRTPGRTPIDRPDDAKYFREAADAAASLRGSMPIVEWLEMDLATWIARRSGSPHVLPQYWAESLTKRAQSGTTGGFAPAAPAEAFASTDPKQVRLELGVSEAALKRAENA